MRAVRALLDVFSPDAVLETGTFLGDTTRFFAGNLVPVYSIEVKRLFNLVAKWRLGRYPDVFPSDRTGSNPRLSYREGAGLSFSTLRLKPAKPAEDHPARHGRCSMLGDEQRTERDLRLAHEQAVNQTGAARITVLLAGASQGGLRAIDAAWRGQPVPARAFIGVAAATPDPRSADAHLRAAQRGLRGWLVTGDRDTTRSSILDFHRAATEQGLPCRLDDIRGLGHEYPPDFGNRLEKTLPFLLGE